MPQVPLRSRPRRTRIAWLACWSVVFHALTGGCNAVLGNEEGALGPNDAATTTSPSPDVVEIDASTPPPADAAGDATGSQCPFGQKACLGACVDLTNPEFGCGDAACDPCGGAHATSVTCGNVNNKIACKLACATGWADCDGDPKNGCEADLSRAATCGACTTTCTSGGPTPLCVTKGAGTFECGSSCTGGTTLCGSQCVDTKTNAAHCNGCGKGCAAPTAGSAKCAGGVCSFECDQGYHRCGDTCVLNTDVSQCGASCRNCSNTAPPGATPSACTNGTCQFACAPGRGDCDNNLNSSAGNGCETNLDSNPSHCGQCFRTCGGGTTTTDGGGPISLDAAMTLEGGTTLDAASAKYCCHLACVPTGTPCPG